VAQFDRLYQEAETQEQGNGLGGILTLRRAAPHRLFETALAYMAERPRQCSGRDGRSWIGIEGDRMNWEL
jgi:hypothetical protein